MAHLDISTGVGASSLTLVWQQEVLWFKSARDTIKFCAHRKAEGNMSAEKDIILHIIGKIELMEHCTKSVNLLRRWCANLFLDDRFTMAKYGD